MTKSEAEALALAKYEQALGTVIETRWVMGYQGDTDHQVGLVFDPPARVRVSRTPRQDVLTWHDHWLDPVWDVESEDERLNGYRSLWIDAPECFEKTA
jgi:hypothetical protein